MDARIKSGHDECVSRGEVEDRFTRTNFNFQTAKTISDMPSRPRGALRPSRAFISRPNGGRGECRMPAAPAVSCALCIGRKHTSNNEYTGIARHSRTQWFYGLCRALPGDRALLPPSPADMFCLSPVGPTQLRELDASVGASGPHDFAVRCNRLSSACCRSLTSLIDLPCNPLARKTLPRPPHPHPASVTIAIRPSGGVGWREFVEMICPTGEAKYFCKRGWTPLSTSRPTGKSPHGSEST